MTTLPQHMPRRLLLALAVIAVAVACHICAFVGFLSAVGLDLSTGPGKCEVVPAGGADHLEGVVPFGSS